MAIHRRKYALLYGVLLISASVGCSINRSDYGICFAPLFRIERNRPGMHGCECGSSCAKPSILSGGAPVMVETQPLPLSEGTVPMSAYPPASSSVIPTAQPIYQTPIQGPIMPSTGDVQSQPLRPSPIFGQTSEQSLNPPASTGQQPSQNDIRNSAKKKPGSLSLRTGLPLGKSAILSVGDRVTFGLYIENTGEEAIASTELEALFSDNLRPISVSRWEGQSKDLLQALPANAAVSGRKVTLERLIALTPDRKIEYQINAEVERGSSENGLFEVVARSTALTPNQPLKKQVAITVTGR